MTAPRRLGLVGLGAISRFYLKAIDVAPNWQLSALCDVAPARLADLHVDGEVPRFTDHRTMLRDAGLDAVVVTAPNDVHATVAHDVLTAGLPVCVEKPIATRLDQAEALARLARESGLCLFTAFHRRYNREISALRERIAGGGVRSLTVRYAELIEDHIGGDNWYLDPGRCGGGAVADNGPNAFDLVRLLLGDVAVTDAEIGYDGDGLDRQASIGLRAADGTTARVELDWSFPGECKDVEVMMADGRRLYADMLDGCVEFKQSLWHEYIGVLDGFDRAIGHTAVMGAIDDQAAGRPDGVAALALVTDAYRIARRTYGPASPAVAAAGEAG